MFVRMAGRGKWNDSGYHFTGITFCFRRSGEADKSLKLKKVLNSTFKKKKKKPQDDINDPRNFSVSFYVFLKGILRYSTIF